MSKEILLVDDDRYFVNMLRPKLEEEGFNVNVAFDGVGAMKEVYSSKPDLVVLDVLLPRLDGYKICRLLKFDERYNHIPIIMVSIRTGEKYRKIGMEMGASAYMSKPLDTNALIKKIKDFLGAVK